MEKKARDFVYFGNTNQYTSLSQMQSLYWACLLIPLCLAVISIVVKNPFPIIAFGIWSLLYWGLIIALRSNRIRKSFELRFLVNGLDSVLLVALFTIFFLTFNFLADYPFMSNSALAVVAVLYAVYVAVLIALTVVGVHKGVYDKLDQKTKSKKFIRISNYAAAFIPVSGTVGMTISRIVRKTADEKIELALVSICFVVLFCFISLGYVNFVKYYYCKKYNITCDEDGNRTSPKLEKPIKVKKNKSKVKNKPKERKKLTVWQKALVAVLAVLAIPIAAFVIVFIIYFIIIAAGKIS